jgi:hypothetical protein
MQPQPVRDSTQAAMGKMSDAERAEIRAKAQMLIDALKDITPSVQMSIENALEVIGAVYAWKAAGGQYKPKAHLTYLAMGEKITQPTE